MVGLEAVARFPGVAVMTLGLVCEDVTQVYATPAGGVSVLRGIDLEAAAGTVTAIAGASGSGKSTLLRLLAAFERPTGGDVVIGGRPTAQLGDRARRRLRGARVGYVFQVPSDNLLPRLSAVEQVLFVARLRGLRLDRAAAMAWLGDDAPLGDLPPARLTAGDQQRIAVLAAAVGRPDVLVADEPTASLDPGATGRLVDRLHHVAGDGVTVIAATHDAALLASADVVVEIVGGTIATITRRGRPPARTIDRAGRVHLPAGPRGRSTLAEVSVDGDSLSVRPLDP